MLIIIKSVEAGWETERRIELPDDEGLVKVILRSVKRRRQSGTPESAAEVEREDASESEQPASAILEKPVDEPPDVIPLERTVFEEPKYRGFIYYHCDLCGKDYAINAHEPVSSVECKGCRSKVALRDMVVAELTCPKCGRAWRYKTNAVSADIKIGCINCGEAMKAEWNAKCRKYVTK